jgi:pyroglutamyl-peptidase
MAIKVLITGFGPFPGAPVNPSAALARALARRRRPAFVGLRRIAHVFPTSYSAVDRALPHLLASESPQIVLLFGLAARTRHLRVETRAQNAVAPLLPDAQRGHRGTHAIAPAMPQCLKGNAPFSRLVAAGRGHGVAVRTSRDAGRYLCNYAYWRALEAIDPVDDLPLVQFVHIPLTRQNPRPRTRKPDRRPTFGSLARAAEAMLVALVSAARRR